MNTICFDRDYFYTYLLLLIVSISVFIYINYVSIYLKPNDFDISILKKEFMNEIEKVRSESILKGNNNQQEKPNYQQEKPSDIFLDKIYNPLISPSPLYPGGSFTRPSFNGYREFQMLGYLTSSSGQFPVMGRYKFPGNSNKYEYQCINEGRNKVKIQFKNKNDEELYDGDRVIIPELGGELTFKKYEDTDGHRYDPNII